MASTAAMRVPGLKLVTCSMPFVSGVISVTSLPLVSPASRFCKFGSLVCARAKSALQASTAATVARGSMPRQLQFTYRWNSSPRRQLFRAAPSDAGVRPTGYCLRPNSDLQQPLRVAAQDLVAILGRYPQIRHPAHAGRIRHERIVDGEENAVGAHLEERAEQRWSREVAAGGDPEMIAKCVAESALAIALARERHVDAPGGKGQRLAQMPEDDLKPGILLEHAREHEANALRRRLHGESPSRGEQPREVLQVIAVVRLHHRRMRHRRVDIDRHIERLRPPDYRPVLAAVDEFAVGEAVDHGALETELRHRALELVRRGARIGARQRGERLEAAVRRAHRLAQPVVGAARYCRCAVRIEALRRRRAVREHLDVDTHFIHLADAQRADVVQALAQCRVARLGPAFLEMPCDFRVYVML